MRKTTLFTLLLALLGVAVAGVAEAGWDEGVAAFKSGSHAQAAKEFQAYVNERPDIYQGHYMLGQVLLQLDRNQEALTHLRKAYELESGNVGVQMVLGKAYLDVGRYGDAAGILGKINTSNLQTAQKTAVHQMLARALDKSGDSSGAVAHLAKAAQNSPKDADLQYQYGAAALKAGDTRTAVAALEKATALDANDPTKQKAYAQALVKLGRTTPGSGKTGAYQKAAAAAQKVVASDPSYDNLMLLTGARIGAKDFRGALASAKQAAGKSSGDWLPQFYMGQAYTQLSQYSPAESSLRQALDKASSSQDKVTVWKQLGFVYEKQKKYNDAKSAYRQAGDNPSIARIEENQKTDQYNKDVEEQNKLLEELAAERQRVEEELKEMGGPPPRR